MNEQDLLLIKYLHQFNNITKTANALFISQPALSARIKRIEKDGYINNPVVDPITLLWSDL